MPRHPKDGYLLGRCNVCCNLLIEAKNILVKENWELTRRIASLSRGAKDGEEEKRDELGRREAEDQGN